MSLREGPAGAPGRAPTRARGSGQAVKGTARATVAPLLKRHMVTELREALEASRVVNVVGPRQVGKTTLVRDLFGNGHFITLDDDGMRSAIEGDAYGQLRYLTENYPPPLIIDEAQRSKQLALAVKRLVDDRRQYGQFILTGSSNIFTSKQVEDSLAGRIRTLTLLPLSGAEIHHAGPARLLDWAVRTTRRGALSRLPPVVTCTRQEYLDLLLRGGYPEIRALATRQRVQRYRDYVDNVVDRDVSDLLKVRKNEAMRLLVNQLAARTGTELNVLELSRVVGIQRPTTEQYLDVLTRLSLVLRLGAYASGEVHREIRHPKIHAVDTGLTAALRNLGPRSFVAGAQVSSLGGILESFVFGEIQKNLAYQEDVWRLYHWRQRNAEIDMVAESGGRLVTFEVKASSSVHTSDFKHMRWFKSEGPGRAYDVTSIVVYLGDEVLSFGERMFALPLSVFWSF